MDPRNTHLEVIRECPYDAVLLELHLLVHQRYAMRYGEIRYSLAGRFLLQLKPNLLTHDLLV